ncbi:MAG: hypothetical protein HRJ53_29525 [Acidobacteria bacterium Pan2503]|uniref:Uncharacterized protein n=1 Tax=Candidatus Acidiferrum panamense TaxID=2741543 RepID=A0A7V8NXG0_9BACT|nr:hypothetical protein [Candidatus Acidoferrum panamensis]
MRALVLLVLMLLFATFAEAQNTVKLSWTLSTNDVSAACAAAGACQQTIYRGAGACSTTTTFSALATLSASQTTYSDTAVPNGTYCYAVTFTLLAEESAKDTATVSLQPPSAPTGLHRI